MKLADYVKNVRDLRVYREAFIVSLEIHQASLSFPKIEQYALADQIRRASKSICANLAEGFSRQASSPVEFRRYVQMAAGSSAEMSVWIEYAKVLGYIDTNMAERWIDKYDHISRMLQNLRISIESSRNREFDKLKNNMDDESSNLRVLESSNNIESSNPRVLESSEVL